MKAIVLFSLATALVAGCATQPRPSPGMASLHIQVVAEPKAGRKMPVAAPVSTYDRPSAPRQQEQGEFELVDYANLDDIVVWVERAGDMTDPTAHATMDAMGTAPPPQTIDVDSAKKNPPMSKPVSVGQKVILRNRSSRPLSIYSVSDGNDFNLGQLAPGQQGEYVVKNAGLVEVLSDQSPDPIASFYAAPTQWVVMTHSHGNVDFSNLPPGKYNIMTWHPRLPGTSQPIELAPDQMASATVTVGVNSLPKVTK